MKIGLFGGTFDPIHRGHIALAQAARQQFGLARVLFVPANIPPHKQKQPLSAFAHRYAMLALATAGEKSFIPSLLEALVESLSSSSGKIGKSALPAANYSIDTIRRLKQNSKKIDQIFFLIGIDAFRDIAKWHESEALFAECEFIVASRPGYSLHDLANALPPSLRPARLVNEKPSRPKSHRTFATSTLSLPGVTIHLVAGVEVPVSATGVRASLARPKARAAKLEKMLHRSVAEYNRKMHLYEGE